jgi:hypothetical protein
MQVHLQNMVPQSERSPSRSASFSVPQFGQTSIHTGI